MGRCRLRGARSGRFPGRLVDTPGLNEVDGATRTAIAEEAATRADLVLFVTDSDLNETEFTALAQIAASQKPLLLVLNKSDSTRPSNSTSSATFYGPRLAGMVDPQNVTAVAADPKEIEYIVESPEVPPAANGASRRRTSEPLRERILKILDTEGKSLVALNAAMYAADKSDRMGAHAGGASRKQGEYDDLELRDHEGDRRRRQSGSRGRCLGWNRSRCRHGCHARPGLRHPDHDGQCQFARRRRS